VKYVNLILIVNAKLNHLLYKATLMHLLFLYSPFHTHFFLSLDLNHGVDQLLSGYLSCYLSMSNSLD